MSTLHSPKPRKYRLPSCLIPVFVVFAVSLHYWWATLHAIAPGRHKVAGQARQTVGGSLPHLTEPKKAACLGLGLPHSSDVWITGSTDWDKYVSPQFGYTIRSLVDHHGFLLMPFDNVINAHSIWKANGSDVTQTLGIMASISPTRRAPAAILAWEAYNPELLAWLRGAAPVFFFADDLHYHTEEQRIQKELTFRNVDALFSTYAYSFRRFYPELTSLPVKWLPHAAAPYFHFDGINETAADTALLSGAINMHYPMRQLAQRLASTDQRIQMVAHPGYGPVTELNTTFHAQDRFATLLRQYRASITCGGALKYGYVVAKMMEIPATGSLMIVDESVVPQLSALGLFPQRHYLTFKDAPTLSRALDSALSKEEHIHAAVNEMRMAAQHVVLTRHTTSSRAQQLASELELWAGAWYSNKHNNTHAYCWHAFVADATIPYIGINNSEFDAISLLGRNWRVPQVDPM